MLNSTLFLLALPSRLPSPSSRALPHLLSRGLAVGTTHLEFALSRRRVGASPASSLISSSARDLRAPFARGRTRLVVNLGDPGSSDGRDKRLGILVCTGRERSGATETGEGSTVFYSSVAEQIEKSKSHWSLLAECDTTDEDEEEVGVSNVRAFRALQAKWGDGFFYLFDEGDGCTLEVGEKFAEGGQAELFHAKVTWGNPKKNEEDQRLGREWVLKVFKEGTSLRHLQSQLPQGLLHFHAEREENMKSPTRKIRPGCCCIVYVGTLLEDGRFAFLMQKEHFDLRNLIERNMELRRGEDGGPFSKEEAELLMYQVALGLDWLHRRDIVHRDLKASNVLIREFESSIPKWLGYVADYECSVGVVGTGFFRAPEILQACKERKVRQRPEVFSRAADVYAFRMTCYEILTGKLPFEGHSYSNYDLVLHGQRPAVPEYVEDWTRELLSKCWEPNPLARLVVGEILRLLSVNSAYVRRFERVMKNYYGENFIIEHYTLD